QQRGFGAREARDARAGRVARQGEGKECGSEERDSQNRVSKKLSSRRVRTADRFTWVVECRLCTRKKLSALRTLQISMPLRFNAFSRSGDRMTESKDLTLGGFQAHIRDRYEKVDRERGSAKTFLWFIEEVGELATALHGTDRANLEEEFAD